MLILKILLLIVPFFLSTAKCGEYTMIEETKEDYSDIKMPPMDTQEVYQTFYSQAHEPEIRPMVKHGKQLTKAPSMCRSIIKIPQKTINF